LSPPLLHRNRYPDPAFPEKPGRSILDRTIAILPSTSIDIFAATSERFLNTLGWLPEQQGSALLVFKNRLKNNCSTSLGRHRVSDSKLNATESPKLFATENKSRDIIILLLE
jgi:hypothetical protein